MVDLTIVNPTDHSFPIGTNLNCPVQIGVITLGNPTIGSGTLNTFTSSAANGNGSYSFNILGVSGSGNWSVNLAAQSDGTWLVQVELTGTFGQNVSFTANAVAQGHSVVFTDINDPSQVLTLAQDNGDWFTNGKITIALSKVSQTLYLYNPS